MEQPKPYFMENKEWYTVVDILRDGFPEDDRGYRLTDKAPQEAIESYNEFYSIHEADEGNHIEQ